MRLKILLTTVVGLAILGTVGLVLLSQQQDVVRSANVSTACPSPLSLITPVDISLVTSMLWPGQIRGDTYRAHGGFRFDTSQPNDIAVRSPLTATLTDASRYLEDGEEQYLLFFSSPCGLHFRFDHLRSLSPKLAEALKDLPPAKPNDSRTTNLATPIAVAAGEEISHSVGIAATPNIFVDFGLYEGAADSTNGLCFFDYLSPDDSAHLRTLPTGNEGKRSDYCQ